MNWRRASLILIAMVVGALPAAGQVPPAAPPILSTQATPPAGAMPEPSQMSGFPLQVAELPPGILAVRVIRQSFATNVPNQTVTVRVGHGSRVLSAQTNADGRVQFNGLPVGDTLQVRAIVGQEFLESQAFTVPAQGGVRMVLVAGVGAGIASFADVWPTPTAVESVPLPVIPPQQPGTIAAPAVQATGVRTSAVESSDTTTLVVGGLLGATFVLAAVMFSRRRVTPHVRATRERDTPADLSAPPGVQTRSRPASALDHRESLLEELVALDRSHRAGQADNATYVTRREALVEQLVDLDSHSARLGEIKAVKLDNP